MSNCCQNKSCELEVLRVKQATTLKTVLVINAVMFIIELMSGIIAGSVSLLADSLDMLGDALVYGISIYVLTRSAREKALSALIKGIIMAAFGMMVLVQAIYKFLYPQFPIAELMGSVAVLALVANLICLLLLWRHRSDDINMNSVWLCSRNDIIANLSVLVASAGVWWLNSAWPDIIIGIALAGLFLKSATFVLRRSIAELRGACV